MFQGSCKKIEDKVNIWHSLLFLLIVDSIHIYSEVGFATSEGIPILLLIKIISFLLGIQLITFIVVHRIVVFLIEKKYHIKTNMKKYFARLVFNYSLFSFSFVFVFMTLRMPSFLNSSLWPIAIVISLLSAFALLVLSIVFNLMLLRKMFDWDHKKAFIAFFLIVMLTIALYAINPYGLYFYFAYLASG